VTVAVALLAPLGCGGDKPAATGDTVAQQSVDSLRNPHEGDQKSAAEGEKLFGSMNCDGCHGGGATGFAAPSLSDGRWRYGGSDGAVFESIRDGRPKGMPAFGELLSPEIIWKLVTYLRSLPVPKTVPTQSW